MAKSIFSKLNARYNIVGDAGMISAQRSLLLIFMIVSMASALIVFKFFHSIPNPVIRIGLVSWPGNDLLLMAQENGLLGNSNFQIVSYPSGQEVIRAFLNHSIDIASLTGDETLRIAESGEQPRIFYVLDFSYGADALVARPPIRSIQELKGKRIAVEPKAIGAYFLVRALDTAGLVLDDVEIVPDLISEQIRTYLDGEVSALVTFEPTLERLKSLGAQTIFSSRDIPEEIFDVLITRPDFLKKHAEDLKKITQAWNLVTEELKRSPGSTIEKLARYYNLTESDVAKILDGIRIPSAEEQKRLLSPTDGSILGKLRKTAQIMYEHKLIRSPEVSAELLVTP